MTMENPRLTPDVAAEFDGDDIRDAIESMMANHPDNHVMLGGRVRSQRRAAETDLTETERMESGRIELQMHVRDACAAFIAELEIELETRMDPLDSTDESDSTMFKMLYGLNKTCEKWRRFLLNGGRLDSVPCDLLPNQMVPPSCLKCIIEYVDADGNDINAVQLMSSGYGDSLPTGPCSFTPGLLMVALERYLGPDGTAKKFAVTEYGPDAYYTCNDSAVNKLTRYQGSQLNGACLIRNYIIEGESSDDRMNVMCYGFPDESSAEKLNDRLDIQGV